MKKKIVLLCLIAMLSFPVSACGNDGYTEMEAMPLQYEETNSLTEISDYLNTYENRKDAAHNMAESARQLGYGESHPVIQLAQKEWGNANNLYEKYKELYNQKYTIKSQQYPEATEIWFTMKSFGWNDYVCAGIMGNMMAESGGNTLYLQPTIVSSNGLYYGLCQWQKGYPGVWWQNINGQLNFLNNTIAYEINTYGGNYKYGFNYDNFMSLENEKKVAEAFLRCYERGSTYTLSQRQKHATYALEYFTN